jgi:hypothetical protein
MRWRLGVDVGFPELVVFNGGSSCGSQEGLTRAVARRFRQRGAEFGGRDLGDDVHVLGPGAVVDGKYDAGRGDADADLDV